MSSATQPFHIDDKPTLDQYRPRLRLKLLSPMLFWINPRRSVNRGGVTEALCNESITTRLFTHADITFSNVPIFLTSVISKGAAVLEIQSPLIFDGYSKMLKVQKTDRNRSFLHNICICLFPSYIKSILLLHI